MCLECMLMIGFYCHGDTSLIIAEDGGGHDVFNIHIFRDNLKPRGFLACICDGKPRLASWKMKIPVKIQV